LAMVVAFENKRNQEMKANFCVTIGYPLGFYRPRKLGHNFPRLYDIIEGETIANGFLQLNPEQRLGADDALQHPYFAQLPKKLYELPDGESWKIELVH